jgi:hypothetical protein
MASRYSSLLAFGGSWWLASLATQHLPWRVIPSSGVSGQLDSHSLPILYVIAFTHNSSPDVRCIED